MLKRKKPRQKGKFSFTNYFQELKAGEKVAVVRELNQVFGYHKRLQGRTGTVLAKQGRAYHVAISDYNKTKNYFIKPVHLKKIQDTPKTK